MAGIPLSSGFNLSAGIPLDLRTVVNYLNDIPIYAQYEGMLVYVKNEHKYYYLKEVNGSLIWIDLNSEIPTHTHSKSDIVDFVHTHNISDIENLQSNLDSKLNISGGIIGGDLAIIGNIAVNRSSVYSNATIKFDNNDNYYGVQTYEILQDINVCSFHSYKKLKLTTSDSRVFYGIEINNFPLVVEGITNGTTKAVSSYVQILRNFDSSFNDSGTINTITGQYVSYGHYNLNLDPNVSPKTIYAYGLRIIPHIRTGTINYMYDIYLGNDNTGGNVIYRYGIYQSNSGTNFFNGKTGIKIIPTYDLDVNGTTRITSISTGVVLSNNGVLSGLNGNSGDVLYHDGTNWINKPLTTVYGSGSGLNADLLDGMHSSDFALSIHSHDIDNITNLQNILNNKLDASNYTALDVLTKIKTVDGSGSGLDADLLDGKHSSDFAPIIHNHNINEITNLQSNLDSKLSINGGTINGDLNINGTTKINNVNTGVVLSNSGVLNGLSGSNGDILYYNGTNWINKPLTSDDVGALPSYSNSQIIPANTASGSWYRIAISPLHVKHCHGIFELGFSGSGYHARIAFRAGNLYNKPEAIYISKLGGVDYLNNSLISIEKVRIVYKPYSYSNEYSYIDVYVKNHNTVSNATLYVNLYNSVGWSLTTGNGEVPIDYTSSELYINNQNPYYSTNDLRSVLTVSNNSVTIDLRHTKKNTVSININGNTTINIIYIYEGAVGNILLYLSATATITLGNMTNSNGDSIYKHVNGNLISLSSGYYIISYKCIPDSSGFWRIFFNVSPKYN